MLPKKLPEFQEIAKDEKLYKLLVQQVNKDFVLAGVDYISFPEELALNDLINSLSSVIERLFTGRYDSYLNFIYRVDVSEKEMLKINSESETFYTDLAKIILKREFQKVWFRSRF